MGDMILTLPVIKSIKVQNPNSEIHVIASTHNVKVLKNINYIDKVLLIKSKEYIIAATAMGYPQNRIILYHVLLNCLSVSPQNPTIRSVLSVTLGTFTLIFSISSLYSLFVYPLLIFFRTSSSPA